MSSASRKILSSQSLQAFLRQERSVLQQEGPILLISSATSNNSNSSSIDTSIQKFQFHAQQEFGLPLISTEIFSAVCTSDDVLSQVKSIQERTKPGVVIGMGSGAAMDVAKLASSADASSLLYLIPSTSAAVLASFTNFGLMLDTKEETILVQDSAAAIRDNESTPTTTLLLQAEEDVVMHPHTIQACQAILLDAQLRGDTTTDIPHDTYSLSPLDLLQETSKHISSGLEQQQRPRSIPLALSCALTPTVFTSTHMFTLWASLVPALLQLQQQAEGSSAVVESTVIDSDYPSLASLALEPASVDRMMRHVVDNQLSHHNGIWDAEQDVLEQVLHTSLNR